VVLVVMVRLMVTDGRGGCRRVLILQQAVDLKPIGPAAVPRPALGHADQETFA